MRETKNPFKKGLIITNISMNNNSHIPPIWSSGNAFVSEAESLRFKSRAGQIGHSFANGLPPQRHVFERSYVTRAGTMMLKVVR